MTTSIRVAAIAAATILSTLATGAAAGDTRPPTAPYIIYASGARWIPGCMPLTIGIQRATDNVTPQSSLRYEVFADGVLLGSLTDYANNSAVWGGLQFTHAGPNTVTVKAVDAAGNRSASSNADVVIAYAC
ncbi:hypothetical protein [Actinoplanes sp. NPDC049599]|uniref:hypothetical protein n=1 Tax=Actinoplanes sp. NPDC049599 TaxID=3363903 RepID=UPI0037AD9711